MSLDPSGDEFFEQLLALAVDDPTLAVRVLRAANSAESAPLSPVESLPAAVARLGANRTAELVASLALTRVFAPDDPRHAELWMHAVEVAVTARLMAEVRSIPGLDPARVYLAGLLHDIGRFVLTEEPPYWLLMGRVEGPVT